jgi:Flp pilus assembly protein TadD
MLTLVGCAGLPLTARGVPPGAGSKDQEGVDLLVRYCEKLHAEGNLVLAAAICQRALDRGRTNETVLLSIAQIMESMSKPRSAAKAYRRILALYPNHAQARYGLGKSYLHLGQYELAQQQFEAALGLGGEETRIYNTLGIIKDKLGDHDTAQEIYRQGLQGSPDNIALRTNLGLSLILSARHADGLEVLRTVATDPRAGVTSRQSLAFAYAITGDMAAAEAVALIDLAPDAAQTNLAYYESLRRVGVGAAPKPEPQSAEQAAGVPTPEVIGMPVALRPSPEVVTAGLGSSPMKRCVIGPANRLCADKQ